jgi:N utilization substance protein B
MSDDRGPMSTPAKKTGGRRRRARVIVLSALYAFYTAGDDSDEVFAAVCGKDSPAADTADFARRLFACAIDNAAEIDRQIREAAANWSFERIGAIDKNILRLGLAELLYLRETPPKTAINEAIELAREYSAEESTKFINGILDAIYRREQGSPPPA